MAPDFANKSPDHMSAQLDQLFAPWQTSDSPGLVVGIAMAGNSIFRKGFGMASLETAVANTPRTRMRIGSTSKHFTCLLALLLAEDGLLDIDRPLRSYLPQLCGPGGDPTLRELMQHRGGGRCYLDLGYLSHGTRLSPPDAALSIQERQKGSNFAAGEAMLYNNSGYHLLSRVIESVAGAPFADLLSERLFGPLGMRDTASIPSDYVITPGIATMHVPASGGGWRRGLFQTEHMLGEGAIVSTVDDMLCWARHLSERDRFGQLHSWATLTNPDPYPDGTTGSYALGIINATYRGLAVLHHPGGVMGGSSSMMTVPQHALDIIVLSNGAPGADVLKLSWQIIDIVLREHLTTHDALIATKDHPSCLGDWWSPETGLVYSIVDEQAALRLRICKNDVSGGGMLKPGPDGLVVCPEFAIGQIGLDLTGLEATGHLPITFGGSVAAYQPVTPFARPQTDFVRFVIGTYYSPDAGTQAIIWPDTDKLKIIFSDDAGSYQADLHQFTSVVGFIEEVSVTGQPNAILNFMVGEMVADGFTINTIRTRGLEFIRHNSALHPPCEKLAEFISEGAT